MLAQINCRSFRNLESISWQPGPGCHLILGPNGAGKTSLLEAVYVLATTRSFRTAQLLDCACHGSSEFYLEAEVEDDQRVQLALGLGPGGRHRSVNGGTTNLIDHLRVLPVVAWTDEDKEILGGSPEKRRRFLDQGIVGTRPTALETLARFRRTLFQKRQLLLGGGRGLKSWNELIATAAAELMSLRRAYVERLSLAVKEIVESTDLDLPDISLEYRPSIHVEGDEPETVLAALEEVSGAEQRERRPLIGPQRDEMVIRWGEHIVRTVGSAGEKKVLGLLLTAARGRVLTASGRPPVFLLDDADSELDEGRLRLVWGAFREAEQVFVSSNRPGVWSMAPDAVHWHLSAGQIGPGEGP